MKKNNLASLTSKDYWQHYWKSHSLQGPLSEVFFSEFLSFFPKANKDISFVELGGFPGNYAGYFAKNRSYQAFLIDYHIDPKVIREVEALYDLKEGALQTLELDLQKGTHPEKKFDVVFSAGFLEHFPETELMFERHLQFLKEKGLLFISVPNFKGIYGWVQKIFHPENHKVHCLKAMNFNLYRQLCQKHRLEIVHLGYAGLPHVWLEADAPVSSFTRRTVQYFSAALQLLGKKVSNRLLSPHIILIARKN